MTSGSPPSAKPAQSRKLRIGQLVSGAAIALAIVFAVLNTDKVKVDWIVVTSHTPLIIVILVSLLLGAVGGTLFRRRS